MSDLYPHQNYLLAALGQAEYESLHAHLELVYLPAGGVLYESGMALQHAYFPTTAILSLLYVMENGSLAETAAVGNDGMLGIALFMGGNTMPNRAMVLCAGYAYRLAAPLLRKALSRDQGLRTNGLQDLLLRYAQALMTQTAQTAVCNRHHHVEQQLCRWLLFGLDHSPSNELIVTQERIAATLGVRREGITEAAAKLKRAGLISCRRGHILVHDRSGLEERVCECYQVVKTEYDRLLPKMHVAMPAAPPPQDSIPVMATISRMRIENRA